MNKQDAAKKIESLAEKPGFFGNKQNRKIINSSR